MAASELFCPIRRERVADLPEERVRQRLIDKMTTGLGYPPQSLAVEKALSQFPHLVHQKSLPDCRVDIACFAKGIHPRHEIFPLLIVECKAVPLSAKVVEQVVGYNYYCGAPFVAVANESSLRLGWRGEDGYEFVETLPSYQELVSSLS